MSDRAYDGLVWRVGVRYRGSDPAFEHLLKVQISTAFKVRLHQIGIGDMGCACHSAPFPAARDYRRRTKHRNRRGKR